jgi:hypothetical protein
MKNFNRWLGAALLVSAALCPTLSFAQNSQPTVYGDWRFSQIGGGGYVLNVVFTKSLGVLYCYSDVGGVFCSDDGGKRWRMLHGTLEGAGSGRLTCAILPLIRAMRTASRLFAERSGGRRKEFFNRSTVANRG